MVKNQKYLFLYALFITLLVFNLGVYFGYKLESSRMAKIDEMYLNTEMYLLDQNVQKEAFEIVDLDCDAAFQSNIRFADMIFEEAQKIIKYEGASRINNEIFFQHKRFDLLRALFWINSIKIKEKCNLQYNNIVYFYEYPEPSLEQKAEQAVFSNLLIQLKEKQGDNVMLIPIAADRDLPSINLLLEEYEIEKLPVILINEETSIEELISLEELENYLY